MLPDGCQFDSFSSMGEGTAKKPFRFYIIKLGRFMKRHFRKRLYEAAKRFYFFIFGIGSRKNKLKTNKAVNETKELLKAGDKVRVLSLDEIEATLDENRRTKGCGFMGIQVKYCGSVQRVFKSMERFVDERDFNVKNCKGMVLLEGVMCEGNEIFGRCDRSCLIFWREEWLEKL